MSGLSEHLFWDVERSTVDPEKHAGWLARRVLEHGLCMGEWMFNTPPLKLSVSEMLVRFEAGPTKFISDFGMAAVHAACAWLIVAPFAVILIKLLVTPVVRKISKKFVRRRTVDIGV